ncbi:uncharacterized protein LOC107019242 [Solanum pennellii]|uniref:Uncharacterized protein LOC107019242 n=1 Tax=Solanum pennellii TaxID=28526 RepID=A0ABM1GSK3_SOLPN|nr:uncharacterized protein LOC107019242 [Solanum pennellii]
MSSSTENGNGSPLWREILKLSTLINIANLEHFDLLTILFLLPFLFTPTVYPSFHLALFHPEYDFINKLIHADISLSNFEIIAFIICILCFILFFLCSVATFTYTTVQVIYDRPINVVSSVKSIRNSFFPLLSTFIISHTILISITLIFTLVLSRLIELKYNLIFALAVVVPILVWLQVNWSLAYVVAVVESKQGFETLRRSAYLVKGMGVRSIVLSMMLFYGLMIGGMVIAGSMLFFIMCTSYQCIISVGILPVLVISVVISYKTMNQYLIGNVLLYMYCNDFNGEKFPLEIGDNECSDEYRSLNTV